MRPIGLHELLLLNHLLGLAGIQCDTEELLVEEMGDGGMGSLRLHPDQGNRQFGKEVGNCEFLDIDGVVVSAALYLDQHGELFELDVWKTNFSPLQKWPTTQDLVEG
ncbi:MAG: DUF6984 family protein [Phycisphaerales bacterium JB063]